MPGLASGVAESPVSGLLTLWKIGLLDLGNSLLAGDVGDGEDGRDVLGEILALLERLRGELDVLRGGVELLELSAAAGEEDETGLVGLQTGNVGGESLSGSIATAVVDSNADGGSELAGNPGLLHREIERKRKFISPRDPGKSAC